MTDSSELFSKIENAAHEGAFGLNPRPIPTDAQTKAGNYKLGRVQIQGLNIAIEQPRHSYRTGVDPKTGKRWTSRLAAHYGFISGYKGADGDPVDVFIGAFPHSEYAFIINQFVNGKFDEHKCMIGFMDESSARQAYLNSYDRGWKGLNSLVKCSLTQLKWWLKNGNLKKPLLPDYLPYEGFENMNQRITWDSTAHPHQMPLHKLLYEMRRADGSDNLLMDSVSMADILEQADEILLFDALVSTYARLERKMQALQSVMNRSGGEISVSAMQISDPFKQNGVAQVAVIYELSDGQTVSVYFHNPDVDPRKIQQGDELISWKWLLNKKDITIIVAPERGEDLNVRMVATRIMKLAAKNSPAFQRANAKRAANMEAIQTIKDEIVVLEKELTDVQHELEVARVEAEDRAARPKPDEEQLTYDEFKLEYEKLFKEMNKYDITQAGSNIFAGKMADLVEKYPEFEKRLDDELQELTKEENPQPTGTNEQPEKSWLESLSPGDTVYIHWLATNQDEPVNYRGKDGSNAVIVKNGQQMQVPLSDLKQFPDIKTEETNQNNEQENQQAKTETETETGGEEGAGVDNETNTETESPDPNDMRGLAFAIEKDGVLITSGSVPKLIEKSEITDIDYYKKLADQAGGNLYVGGMNTKNLDDPSGLIFGMTWEEIQARQQGKMPPNAIKSKMPDDAVMVYSSQSESVPEPESNPNQPHIDTLQAIVDGQHDSEDLNALLDTIDQAAQALIDAGKAEEFDTLIGAAAEKWAELDQKANG